MATREYPRVKKLSRNVEMLMLYHQRVIDERTAIDTIYAYLDENEVDVEFTGKVNGRCWYGECCRITLPPSGSEYLTMGLVLHETAHALSYHDKKHQGHGREFIRTLDSLVSSESEFSK